MPGLRLNVLDQSPISEGSTGADALHNTLDLAQLADRLGYGRYWVAEHHATPMLACASPEVLIGPIAAATERLRVGSGGVMLPHYSPLKVAERFSILSGLYPGRIDLGIGRAPGTDRLTMLALQRDRRQPSPDDFPEQLTELLALLEDRIPADHPFARLAALPGGPHRPEVWLLGSSPQSAIWAAELGLPYSFADFINPGGAEIAAEYRRRFRETGRAEGPLVPRRDGDLRRDRRGGGAARGERPDGVLASAHGAARAGAAGGHGPALPRDPRERTGASGRRAVIGSPSTVREGLEEVAREYGAEELTVVTITHEHEARRRSYELIAEAFALDAAGTAPAATGAQP